jgi:hypothetical protein
MNKKLNTILVSILLIVLIGYIIFDLVFKKENNPVNSAINISPGIEDKWMVSNVFEPGKGQLNAVTVSNNGNIILGGESFVACYDPDFKLLWEYKTDMPVSALAVSENNVYAAVQENILVLNIKGKKTDEWGPFEDKAIITSLASNESYVAFADAGNKLVFVLDKKGSVKSLIGKSGEPFYIPSSFFDLSIDKNNNLYLANTGNRRIETRNIDGKMLSSFGKPGMDPDAFCGCCNPAHFALIPGGFVTAEKGINRIKILNEKGDFVEFVSSVNSFIPALPLDLAATDGKIIYAANPADSKLYEFRRK